MHVADLTAVIGFYPDLKPLQRHTGVGLRIGVTINGARSDDFRPCPVGCSRVVRRPPFSMSTLLRAAPSVPQ